MPGRPRMSSGRQRLLLLLALLTAVLAVAVAFSSRAFVAVPAAPLALESVPVPLDEQDPSRDRLGRLLYLGGLWLRSTDPRFGGLSDLRVSADGSRLFAVSDCGEGITATLSYDAAGRLAKAEDARITPLAGARATALASASDAESLVLADELEVGFEGRPRILAYRVDPPFGGPPRALRFPQGVALCGLNGGLETMADLGDGRRLLLCEKRRNAASTVPAWVAGTDGTWTEREYPLAFVGGWGGEPFRPTGAAVLPGGDLLVLERRFPPLAARIVRVERGVLDGTGPLAPREVAVLQAPLTVDNFEGVDVRPDASGRALVYLVSDDNNCAKNRVAPIAQRTLLLMFALEG